MTVDIILPYPARLLVPHRPPMLLIHEFLSRDSGENDNANISAFVPENGIFISPKGLPLPEYYLELLAQSMAALNGYDALIAGAPPRVGYLVGVDEFKWLKNCYPGESCRIEVSKTFEFGPASIMEGIIKNKSDIIAKGILRVWEEQV